MDGKILGEALSRVEGLYKGIPHYLPIDIHGMSDIEFSEFIAIFDIWGVLLLTIYSKLRVIAPPNIEYSDVLAIFDLPNSI